MCRNHVCPHVCCSPEGKRQKRLMARYGGISRAQLNSLPEPWRESPSRGGSVAERMAHARTLTDTDQIGAVLSIAEKAKVRAALAEAPGLTVEQQEQLATDEDRQVLLALAGNPVTDESVLKALAGDGDAKVQAAAKANLEARAKDCPEDAGTLTGPSAERIAEMAAKLEALKPEVLRDAALHTNDPAVLAALSESDEMRVRDYVARNEATDQATLARLADDESGWVRHMAASRVTDRDALMRLVDDSEKHAVYAALQNPAMNPNDLDALATRYEEEDNTKALALVAGNASTSPATLQRIAHRWANPSVLYEVGTNPNVPAETMRELAKHSDPIASDGLLRNPKTPGDILEELSYQANSGGARANLASHPNTPTSVLERLVERGDTDHLVAAHPNASPELLEKLAARGESHPEIAQNPATPPALLDKLGVPGEEAKIRRGLVDIAALAQSEDATIRGRVARATVDRKVFAELLTDKSKDVRAQALRNPMADEYIDQLAGDRAVEIRKAVAKRTSNPDVLAKLAGDSDEGVCEAVVGNRATPAEALGELVRRDVYGSRAAAEAAYAARGEQVPPLAPDEHARTERESLISSARTMSDGAELAKQWRDASVGMDEHLKKVVASNPAAPVEARAWGIHQMDETDQSIAFDRARRQGDIEMFRYAFSSPKVSVRQSALEDVTPDFLPEVAQLARDRSPKVRESARIYLQSWSSQPGDVGRRATEALEKATAKKGASTTPLPVRKAKLAERIEKYNAEIATLERKLKRIERNEAAQPSQGATMGKNTRVYAETSRQLNNLRGRRSRATTDLQKLERKAS